MHTGLPHRIIRNMLVVLVLTSLASVPVAFSTWQDLQLEPLRGDVSRSFTEQFITDETLNSLRDKVIADGHSSSNADKLVSTVKSELGQCVARDLVESLDTDELDKVIKDSSTDDARTIEIVHESVSSCMDTITERVLS